MRLALSTCSGKPRIAASISCGSIVRNEGASSAVSVGMHHLFACAPPPRTSGCLTAGAFSLFDEPLYFLSTLVTDLFVKRGAVFIFDGIAAFLPDVFEEARSVALFCRLAALAPDLF